MKKLLAALGLVLLTACGGNQVAGTTLASSEAAEPQAGWGVLDYPAPITDFTYLGQLDPVTSMYRVKFMLSCDASVQGIFLKNISDNIFNPAQAYLLGVKARHGFATCVGETEQSRIVTAPNLSVPNTVVRLSQENFEQYKDKLDDTVVAQ